MARQIAEPRGESALVDAMILRWWEGYAWAYRLYDQVVVRPHTNGGAGTVPRREHDRAWYRRHILEDLLPFWRQRAVDEVRGGFITQLDRRGEVYERDVKTAPMHARLISAFSIGHLLQPDAGHLDVAEHGLAFLREHLWDRDHGGWFRSVDGRGRMKDPCKAAFDHAYVLIGLARYYQASGDAAALPLIDRTVEVIEARFRDSQYDGYLWRLDRDWSLDASKKTACAHIDILVAYLALTRWVDRERYLPLATRVADLIVTRMCDATHGLIIEIFHRDWRYSPLPTRDRVDFGHVFKGGSALLDLSEMTGARAYRDAGKRNIDLGIRRGWDSRHDGVFTYGARNGLRAQGDKLFWTQCEALTALIRAYEVTGDEGYRDLADRLTGFCERAFIDQDGAWFWSVHADGAPLDDRKGTQWKAGYHTTQACYDAFRGLAPRA